jgi:hypothetical protein
LLNGCGPEWYEFMLKNARKLMGQNVYQYDDMTTAMIDKKMVPTGRFRARRY